MSKKSVGKCGTYVFSHISCRYRIPKIDILDMLLASICEFTPMYHTSFFMIFLAGHSDDTLVHDFAEIA